ncbi:MAG: pyridoxal-phosphate dependent enzyme, partial [Acetobacteraceae bacterium]
MASDHKPLTFDLPLRGRIYDNIAETIGNTPLVRIPKISAEEGVAADICLKLEFFNPLSSVKDRIGVNMILDLEESGKLKPGGTIIEPTSGNTGIGLAFVAAARGYRLILTMPESVSIERRKMLAYLGAELELTPREKGMNGAVARAKELLAATPGAVAANQFGSPANPAIHIKTTAEEIWYDTRGEVDAIISGVGTGGTLTGVSHALKPRRPSLRVFAVEP